MYRAVDSIGQTIDFLLTAKRDPVSAKRFLRKVFANPASVQPSVINVDKNPAYPAAIKELKDEGMRRRRCRVRQCKYLNNIVEQDHRTVKRRAGPQAWTQRFAYQYDGYDSWIERTTETILETDEARVSMIDRRELTYH